ncbi:MAG: DUF3040 domain-containing protein [Corynebacterium sp.]|uniref:DUF3040 domain-containing protein n=1 Tax=Corynebacterium sp. TaxID=1720 RepID=UPI0026DAA6FD|nr:DUF3040 domain-containing protein [Corynebacterium sp.]MDO5097907.1 DUF3040 domain-containing protein [Corynebacterium sp.]
MALSEHEQQLLKEIEQSLLAEDPKFGAAVAGGEFGGQQGLVTLRGIAVIVIGLVLLVTGVALSQVTLWLVALSVLGFLVMVAGGVWMLRGGGAVRHASLGNSTAGNSGGRRGGLGDRMEDNFRRRFEN